METLDSVKIIDYLPDKDMALFAYIGKTGKSDTLWVAREIFKSMMGTWNSKKYGNMHVKQVELRDVVSVNVKGNTSKWFDKHANLIMIDKVNKRDS